MAMDLDGGGSASAVGSSIVECCLCGWTLACADNLLFYPPPHPIYNEEWHHQWLLIIAGRCTTDADSSSTSTDLTHNDVERAKLVCSRHFEDNCFMEENHLKVDALPTKFLDPHYLLVSTSSQNCLSQAISVPMETLLDFQSNVSSVPTTAVCTSFQGQLESSAADPAVFEPSNIAQESVNNDSNNYQLVNNEIGSQPGNVSSDEDEQKPIVEEIIAPITVAATTTEASLSRSRTGRKRKQWSESDDQVPPRRMRLRSGTLLSDSTPCQVPATQSPSRSITITLTDCIKELERSIRQKNITHNSSFKLDASGNITSVIKSQTTPISVHDEIAKLKAEVESLKKQAFLSSGIMTCFPSLVEKAKDYMNLINRIKSSTNPDVQALLSDVPSCSRETAAMQEVSVSARRRGRPAVQSDQLIDEVVDDFPLSESELDNIALRTNKASMFIRKVMRRTFSSDYLATNTYNQMSFSQKSYQKVIIDATRKRFHLIQRTKGDVQKLTVNYIKHVMRSEFNVHHEAKKRFQSSL